jgi:hypothetical protein
MLKNFASYIVALSAVSLTVRASNAQEGRALKLWQAPSYFRGFVISPNVPISQEDIFFVKGTGATVRLFGNRWFSESHCAL